MDEKQKSYRDLHVWQRSIEVCVEIYDVTRKFPKEETYGITSQMRRACISITSNIAEGRHRGTKKDFVQFLRIALGSGAELESQIELAKRLPPMKELNFSKSESLLGEVMKMLHVMIKKLTAES